MGKCAVTPTWDIGLTTIGLISPPAGTIVSMGLGVVDKLTGGALSKGVTKAAHAVVDTVSRTTNGVNYLMSNFSNGTCDGSFLRKRASISFIQKVKRG